MSDLTIHAAGRVRERVGARSGHELRQLDALWSGGREAKDGDFAAFETAALVGRVYRIAVKGGIAYLISRSKFDGAFITIMRKRTR